MAISIDAQIAAARDVSVARVVRATLLDEGVRYDFVVVKRLIGPYRKEFSIVGRGGRSDDVEHSSDHSDEAFWQAGGGRLGGQSNFCFIQPRFDVGESYLVFFQRPYNYRSFERIQLSGRNTLSDDKWLAHVEARLVGKPVFEPAPELRVRPGLN